MPIVTYINRCAPSLSGLERDFPSLFGLASFPLTRRSQLTGRRLLTSDHKELVDEMLAMKDQGLIEFSDAVMERMSLTQQVSSMGLPISSSISPPKMM